MDERLLERFLASGDAAAFEALVARHGPMVMGVCRQVLGDPHDAEDAFQATFLALARHARTIRDRGVLGSWLYGVAYRVASRARAEAARRHSRERTAAEVPDVDTVDDADWRDLREALHEELSRLPAKYRDPVVLCYLEGRTHEEAAGLLRWPVGSVKGRLARARQLLQVRLARHDLAIPATVCIQALSSDLGAPVDESLARATSAAAAEAARGEGGPPRSRAARWADVALRRPPWPHAAAAVVLRMADTATAGAGWLAGRVWRLWRSAPL